MKNGVSVRLRCIYECRCLEMVVGCVVEKSQQKEGICGCSRRRKDEHVGGGIDIHDIQGKFISDARTTDLAAMALY